mmetsp:Transcript_69565/g.166851  ORF Transcript_69565/g.166851 Transcript_69565/m.166851 type:complete len:733 (+) Transcript_69565:159-2357(+)
MPAEVADVSEQEPHVDVEDVSLFNRARGMGVCAEPIRNGYYRPPFWVKHQEWEDQLFRALRECEVFRPPRFSDKEITTFVKSAEVHMRYKGEVVVKQGFLGDACLVILEGKIDFYRGETVVKSAGAGEVINATDVLFTTRSPWGLVAAEEVTFAKLRREDFMNISVRLEFYRREERQDRLRNCSLLEMMNDEAIAKLGDALDTRFYDADVDIIKQGAEGHEIYILMSGEAYAWGEKGNDKQVYREYKKGDLFGERAPLKNQPRAAYVTTKTRVEVLVLHKDKFERLIGPINELQSQNYITDPRVLIADFYDKGDHRGPNGVLKARNLTLDQTRVSSWFAVYRPTSRDAIQKMLQGNAVGKGLNVKGKSAKCGVLSGFVPFCQISDNKHRAMIEKSPPGARLQLYFRTKQAREEATKQLQAVMEDPKLEITKPRQIITLNDYQEKNPKVFGIDLPEAVLREAYIMRADLSPVLGWETGRRSEPAFMDMNLHAVRDESEPKVVLFQWDESNPMNPRGLLIAYAEEYVKPVVSDFDTFCIGSKGMEYAELPSKQADLVVWCLNHTRQLLENLDGDPWTSKWLGVLAKEKAKGHHVELPKYGFGDPVSYDLIGAVVQETSSCGAVRHGAECCNFYFPQELDDEFLVVWHGFKGKPWEYYTEKELREWLIERVHEGFAIPLNPVWPVRDKGWYEVFQALRGSADAQPALKMWYPPTKNIVEMIDEIHSKHPQGFTMT